MPKTDSSSSGHSIAASAVRSVSTSSRSWKLLPPTSRCGNPRASSAWTYGRVTSTVGPSNVRVSKRRNKRHTSRASIGQRSVGRSRSVTVQPLDLTSQSTKAATACGCPSTSDAFVGAPFHSFTFGTGSATIAGWPCWAGRTGASGT